MMQWLSITYKLISKLLNIRIPQQIVTATEHDAQEFLKIDANEFNRLASEWSNLGKELWQRKSPEEFYKSWRGIYGMANICANIKDQFTRNIVYYELKRHCKGRKTFLDCGCGTGVMSFPFIKRFEKSYLLDVDNLSKDFLKFRCEKYGLKPIILDEKGHNSIPDSSVDLCLCIDVLEHVENPSLLFSVIDSKLEKGSILIFTAPFGDYYEHLEDAQIDWHEKGGKKLLSDNYRRKGLVSYKKIR